MKDRLEFDIELPNGEEVETINSTDLNDQQYALAVQMQQIQGQVQNLTASVNEYNLKQDHFRLKQKELMELIENDGSDSGDRQEIVES